MRRDILTFYVAAQIPWIMNRIRNLLFFFVTNFGPLLGFYIANQFWGFRAAITISMAWILVEFSWFKLQKKNLGTFFYFSSAIILVFGAADLTFQKPIFMKFEASVTNILFAGFFGLSLFKDKPIVQELAEAQKRTSAETSADKTFFFQFLTILWCSYFVMKAAFYFFLAFHSTLEQSLVARVVVGKVSFWAMMFLSVGIPRQMWRGLERLRLFPSQRTQL